MNLSSHKASNICMLTPPQKNRTNQLLIYLLGSHLENWKSITSKMPVISSNNSLFHHFWLKHDPFSYTDKIMTDTWVLPISLIWDEIIIKIIHKRLTSSISVQVTSVLNYDYDNGTKNDPFASILKHPYEVVCEILNFLQLSTLITWFLLSWPHSSTIAGKCSPLQWLFSRTGNTFSYMSPCLLQGLAQMPSAQAALHLTPVNCKLPTLYPAF